MSDSEMTVQDRPPLFFAGSDDEEEDVFMEPLDGPSSSRASSRASSRLFSESADGSDGEKDPGDAEGTAGPQKRPIHVDDDSDSDIQSVPPPRIAAKVENASATGSKAGPSRKGHQQTSAPPTKKRRISSPTPPKFPPTFIGDMVFAHAWSNVSGKGYIKINEEVKIMREPQESKKSGAETKSKKTGDGKKQMSLTAMLKQPAKTSKNKKTDNIVRLYNSRGFGTLIQLAKVNCSLIIVKNSDAFLKMCHPGWPNFWISVSLMRVAK